MINTIHENIGYEQFEQTYPSDAELQKVFSENHEIPFYVLCITIDYRGDEPWRQRVNTEIRNVKGSGKLYLKCKGYINNELTRLILK